MAIVRRSTANTARSSFSQDPYTVSVGTTNENDLMLLHLTIGLDPTVTVSVPSGWALVNSAGGSNSCHIYWKRAGSSEAAFDVDPDGFTFMEATVTSWYDTGGLQLNVDANADQINAVGDYDWPSVTPTSEPGMLLCFMSLNNNATLTPPSGMTETYEFAGATSGEPTMYLCQLALASTSPTGTKSATRDSGTNQTSKVVSLVIVSVADDGGVFRTYYGGTEITDYVYAASLQCQIEAIEASTFATDTHDEYVGGIGNWELSVSGWWDKVSDDLLGQDMVNGSPNRTVECRIRDRDSAIYVRYTWVQGNIYLYNVPAVLRGAIEFTANLVLSGSPTRAVF